MKNILITGSSTGIGYVTADHFLKKGYRVFGSVRTKEDATRLSDELGENFVSLIFDVTDNEAILKAKKEVEQQLGKEDHLHCLVNNAGMSVNGPMAFVSVDQVNKQFDVNVAGLLRVTQAFLPLLGFDNGREKGTIVNIGSLSGRVTRPFMGPYSASKHAVEALSDAMRRELADFGIKVALVEPGPIRSEIWAKARKTKNEYRGTPYENIYDNMEKAVDTIAEAALPTEKVSALIYKIAESSNPKTRYLITPRKFLAWTAIHIFSDRSLDKMFQKQIRKISGK